MLMALGEISSSEEIGKARGGKLLLLLLRMFLHRAKRGGTIPRYILQARFQKFAHGQSSELLRESTEGSETAASLRARRCRRRPDDIVVRAARAQALVVMGEISSGRQALEGVAVARGTDHTLHLLTDRERRPPNPVRELSPKMLEFVPAVPFALDEKRFALNLLQVP